MTFTNYLVCGVYIYSCIYLGELKHQRRRLQKRHFTIRTALIKLYRVYSTSFNSTKNGKFLWSWILKNCIEVQEKKMKIVVLHSRYPQNGEIYSQFHFEVVQRRQRNVWKSVKHVQSWCFANPNLLLFGRSRCRRSRRLCLSFLVILSKFALRVWLPRGWLSEVWSCFGHIYFYRSIIHSCVTTK